MNDIRELRSTLTDLGLMLRERLQTAWSELADTPSDSAALRRMVSLTEATMRFDAGRDLLLAAANAAFEADIPF